MLKNFIPFLLTNIKLRRKYNLYPYTKFIYQILIILIQEQYLLNCSLLNLNKKIYILIEFNLMINNLSIKHVIKNQYFKYYTFKKLCQLQKYQTLFIISTIYGVKSLSEVLKLKIGGILLLIISN